MQKNGTDKKSLYNRFISEGLDPYGYSYADDSYSGNMNAEELANLLNKFINKSTPHSEYRTFTAAELTEQKVYLENIDTEATSKIEDFITYGSTTYTFAQAKAAGVVKPNNEVGPYYVDLSVINTTEQIYVKYQTLPEAAE